MLDARVDANLRHPGPHGPHGFPVVRRQPVLHQVQLVAGQAPRGLGEAAQVVQGGADELEGLLSHAPIYKLLYVRASGLAASLAGVPGSVV